MQFFAIEFLLLIKILINRTQRYYNNELTSVMFCTIAQPMTTYIRKQRHTVKLARKQK